MARILRIRRIRRIRRILRLGAGASPSANRGATPGPSLGATVALPLAILACAAAISQDEAVPASPAKPSVPSSESRPEVGALAGEVGWPELEPAALQLREALAAAERGEVAEALASYVGLAKQHPVVGDYADLYRGRLFAESGQSSQAAATMLDALAAHSSSPLRPDFHQLLGDAREAFHEEEAARAAWNAALDETSDSGRRAALRASIALSLERSGDAKAAADVYRTLWIHHPLTPEGRAATRRLEVLSVRDPALAPGASDWRRRGDQLFRERRNEEALEAYDRALASGLSGAEGRRARKQRAHTLFRMRRYPEALESFEALPQEDEVKLWRARSMARAGQVFEAVAAFEELAASSRGAIGARARYLAAILLDGRGKDARAQEYYARIASARPTQGLANAALWRLGWSAYREGRHADAAKRFEALAEADRDAIGRLRARYWAARSREELGEPQAAGDLLALAQEFPFSYYGWRASGRGPFVGSPLPPQEISDGRRRLTPGQLARPRILLQAGLAEEGREELRRAARRARSLQERLELAGLFTRVGDFNGAQRVVVDAYQETLARGPVPERQDLWSYAWPIAYGDQVRSATADDGVEPELVLSIMREESGYRPAVVSVSGARGLLQIMPTTGERLAQQLGRHGFGPDRLFEPTTNIDLGAFYLAELSRRFDGRLSAAIASYNAGPSAVSGWLKRGGAEEDDEWVESIPYDQTRAYVKRVLRSLHAYRMLY